MAASDLGRLLRWYPSAWRDRYGEEFVVYMQDSFGSERPPLKARLSVVAGGMRERARRSGLTGDSVPPAVRVRAGMLMVLVSWTAMVIAGSSLAKISEHFDTALPNGRGVHHLPDLAYTVIQTTAGIAALIVVVGAGLALPTFVRYLRSGGWSSIRSHALRAAGCTFVTGAVTATLLVWAHHLTPHQRNGGSTVYTVLFAGWAALVVVSLALWTVLAVASARKVTFSPPVLTAEAGIALAVTIGMVAILAASTLWWATMAERAPAFLSGKPSSAFDAQLVATVTLMALAAAAAIAGAIRIVHSLPASHRS